MTNYVSIVKGAFEELDIAVTAKSGKKNPDYYKTLKEYRLVTLLLQALTDGIDEELFNKTFVNKGTTINIIVHEGDNVLELLDKYKDVKDGYNKIKKAAEKVGLKLEGATVVKA